MCRGKEVERIVQNIIRQHKEINNKAIQNILTDPNSVNQHIKQAITQA